MTKIFSYTTHSGVGKFNAFGGKNEELMRDAWNMTDAAIRMGRVEVARDVSHDLARYLIRLGWTLAV